MWSLKEADHIYILNNGRIVEQGTHDMLMATENGYYWKSFGLQVQSRAEIDEITENAKKIDSEEKGIDSGQ